MDAVCEFLRNDLTESGFEVYPFLISWYNAVVESTFKLDYEDSTVAFLIISTPQMFERTFLPYALTQHKGTQDPIDSCVKQRIESLVKRLPEHDIDVIYDYELWPNRRPKIVMQTVGYVSGATYFYNCQRWNYDPLENADKKNQLGVCIHPKYGGWFALRSVLIFKTLKDPLLKQIIPEDHLKGDETQIADLLRRFNNCWQDNTYRDVVPSSEKYSQLQQSYFRTVPRERLAWLKQLRETTDRLLTEEENKR